MSCPGLRLPCRPTGQPALQTAATSVVPLTQRPEAILPADPQAVARLRAPEAPWDTASCQRAGRRVLRPWASSTLPLLMPRASVPGPGESPYVTLIPGETVGGEVTERMAGGTGVTATCPCEQLRPCHAL